MTSIFLLILLLIFSAVLSSSETAFFSLSTFTISSYKIDPDNRKKLIGRLLDKPRELLVTILILNTLSNVLVQNTVSDIFGNYPSWLLKVGLPLVLTLFFGEVIPKSIAIMNNKTTSYKVAPFIVQINQLFFACDPFHLKRFWNFFLFLQKKSKTDKKTHKKIRITHCLKKKTV